VPLRSAVLLPDKRLLALLTESGKVNPEIAQLLEREKEDRDRQRYRRRDRYS
jgi:hypothetical protein